MKRQLSEEEHHRIESMMLLEKRAEERGFKRVAGVDEVGRGSLAGPVVAAACILPEAALIEGVNDSKKLLPSERGKIFQRILALAEVDYGIGIIDALIIDQVNILQATFQAMTAALSRLSQKPDFILVDGDKLPPLSISAEAVVKGDQLSQSIAAASIIAKETRDQLMRVYHAEWPQYGFDSHKGYATQKHLIAIQKHGPCAIHRMSFEPLKSIH